MQSLLRCFYLLRVSLNLLPRQRHACLYVFREGHSTDIKAKFKDDKCLVVFHCARSQRLEESADKYICHPAVVYKVLQTVRIFSHAVRRNEVLPYFNTTEVLTFL